MCSAVSIALLNTAYEHSFRALSSGCHGCAKFYFFEKQQFHERS